MFNRESSFKSSDEEFGTPSSQISNKTNNSIHENSPRQEDVANCALPEDNHEQSLDVLLERHGFNLVTKNCRAILVSNTTGKLDESKIVEPPWAINKSGQDETPIDLEQIIAKTGHSKMPDISVSIIRPDNTQIKTESTNRDEEVAITDIENEGQLINESNNESTIGTKSSNKRSKKLFINPLAVIKKSPSICVSLTKTITIDKENVKSNNIKETESKPSSSRSRGGPYLIQEEILILRFILDGHYEAVVQGNTLWRLMEEQNVCSNRSWQSMKNRFKRNILQNLSRSEYKLTKEEIFRIRNPQTDSSSKHLFDSRLINLTKDLPKLETKKTLTKKRKKREEKADIPKGFYSLNMNWSDSDSD